MKFAVGVMLTSFGMFWGTEGAGASWPGGDAALLASIPGVLASAVAISRVVGRARRDIDTTDQPSAMPAQAGDPTSVNA